MKNETAFRLIHHIHIHSSSFDRSSAFYLALFDALGHGGKVHRGRDWLELNEFYLDQAEAEIPPSRIHLCFSAQSRAEVQAFHAAGIAAGGTDNGGPGLRDYHPGYYAAYVLDPDGNNIEAKFDEQPA